MNTSHVARCGAVQCSHTCASLESCGLGLGLCVCVCVGKYFTDCVEQSTLPKATDEDTAETLWKLSEEMVHTT